MEKSSKLIVAVQQVENRRQWSNVLTSILFNNKIINKDELSNLLLTRFPIYPDEYRLLIWKILFSRLNAFKDIFH